MAGNIAIDTSRIQAMAERMRDLSAGPQASPIASGARQAMNQMGAALPGTRAYGDVASSGAVQDISPEAVTEVSSTTGVDFSEVLKQTLQQVSSAQNNAKKLSENFSMGNDDVDLSDVMIAMQKASISFQTTVQVRNKLVSAYRDIMTMQI